MLGASLKLVAHCFADPATRDWFLMSSPLPTIAIMGVYLWFVNDVGPKMMAHRQPFKLNRIIQVYNAIQIFLSAYTCYKVSAASGVTLFPAVVFYVAFF